MAVGVRLIVVVAHSVVAGGRGVIPTAALIPVAPVVVWVIGVIAVFTHTVGLELGAEAVLFGLTTIVPVAFTVPHPPVNGML